MTEADGQAFASLCVTEALFLRVAPKVDQMALAEGCVSPDFKVLLELLKERRAQHAQFGMTPASRSKIVTSDKHQDDPLESALSH